jgi:hypothetical protein
MGFTVTADTQTNEELLDASRNGDEAALALRAGAEAARGRVRGNARRHRGDLG